MVKILITGTSSGIGKALTEKLVRSGHDVMGISRYLPYGKSLNSDQSTYRHIVADLSKRSAGSYIIRRISLYRFIPEVVIFNAADTRSDYGHREVKIAETRHILEVNFFSIIDIFNKLSKKVKPGALFIFINSSSAYKGSGVEGVGYAASKAALSVLFESLNLHYGNRYKFCTVYLSPVDVKRKFARSSIIPIVRIEDAVNTIISALGGDKPTIYNNWIVFGLLKLLHFLPPKAYFKIVARLDKLRSDL